MKDKTIFDLQLHEAMLIGKTERASISVIRVPGGFIYQSGMNGMFDSCFVPYEKKETPEAAYKKELLGRSIRQLKDLKHQLEGESIVDHTSYLSKFMAIVETALAALSPKDNDEA